MVFYTRVCLPKQRTNSEKDDPPEGKVHICAVAYIFCLGKRMQPFICGLVSKNGARSLFQQAGDFILEDTII